MKPEGEAALVGNRKRFSGSEVRSHEIEQPTMAGDWSAGRAIGGAD